MQGKYHHKQIKTEVKNVNEGENRKMTTKKQKEKERFILDRFLNATRIQPKKVADGKEPPDFYIYLPDEKTVGIEITEHHSSRRIAGRPRREFEEHWKKLNKVIDKYRMGNANTQKIMCLLCFKGLLPPRGQFTAFAREVVNFIASHASNMKETFDDLRINRENKLLIQYLYNFRVSLSRFYNQWTTNYAADWIGLTEEELLATLKRKINGTVPNDGKKEEKEDWLIIYSGTSLSQSMGDLSADKLNSFTNVQKLLRKGPYTKVYILDYMESKVFLWETSTWKEYVCGNREGGG